MARPKKAEGDHRDQWLGFRVSASELEAIEREADRLKLSQSDYLRHCATKRTLRVVADSKKADPVLIGHLLAIGNNLNQIARKLNSTDRVPDNLNETLQIVQRLLIEAGKGYDS
jgi:Bacterial mobilisation protein (MobC)